jgi:hypothetical protein
VVGVVRWAVEVSVVLCLVIASYLRG